MRDRLRRNTSHIPQKSMEISPSYQFTLCVGHKTNKGLRALVSKELKA